MLVCARLGVRSACRSAQVHLQLCRACECECECTCLGRDACAVSVQRGKHCACVYFCTGGCTCTCEHVTLELHLYLGAWLRIQGCAGDRARGHVCTQRFVFGQGHVHSLGGTQACVYTGVCRSVSWGPEHPGIGAPPTLPSTQSSRRGQTWQGRKEKDPSMQGLGTEPTRHEISAAASSHVLPAGDRCPPN